MPRLTAPSSTRLDGLDGLRGFAALSVVVAHLVISMGLLPWAPLGAIGVLVFFALSGYLIAGTTWRTVTSWAAVREFLARRVRRLLPGLVAMSVVTGAVFIVAGGTPVRAVLRDAALALSQTTALAMVSGVDTSAALVPTWSLTVEWAFYLTFPVVILALRRSPLGLPTLIRMLWTLAAVLYALGLLLSPRAFYLLPVANLGVMVTGAALALSHVESDVERAEPSYDPTRSRMAVLLLLALVVLPGDTLSWGWKVAVLPGVTAATLAVLHAVWARDASVRFLRHRLLRAVGVRAYSLYLWHMPVLWVTWFSMPGSAPLLRAAVGVAATTVVTLAAFELFERPGLRPRVLVGVRGPQGAVSRIQVPSVAARRHPAPVN